MPDWLLSRPLFIGLAIVGGACSLLASWCQSREAMKAYSGWLTKASYGFVGASMLVFIAAGMFGSD